jgi:hypothetical protein
MVTTGAMEAGSLPSDTGNGIVYLKGIAPIGALANLQNCEIFASCSISRDNVGLMFQIRLLGRTEHGFARRSR